MKTLISPLHQDCEPQPTTNKKSVLAIAASINEVLALLSAVTAAAAIPNAELVWVKDAGHWLIDEKRDEIGDHINQFLD